MSSSMVLWSPTANPSTDLTMYFTIWQHSGYKLGMWEWISFSYLHTNFLCKISKETLRNNHSPHCKICEMMVETFVEICEREKK